MRGENRIVARIASRQHGVVARAQLLAAGLGARAIERRVERGLLLPEYRGVYRVGHRAPSPAARYAAAVLACGPGALLAGRAAGRLLELLKGAYPAPEVLTPTERRVRGVRTRRARVADPRDATVYRGIPVTTVARTLVDLAAVLGPDALARAFHEADVLHGTTPEHVAAILARRPRSRGAGTLRRVVEGDAPVLLSKLERRFRALLRAEGLPLPVTNRSADGYRVDCRWPDHRLTVELDSYRFHRTRHAWEQDRRRDRAARARGDEHRRYTWSDLERPRALLDELRELLRSRRS
jgi:very-short-patch-repair endonuclease